MVYHLYGLYLNFQNIIKEYYDKKAKIWIMTADVDFTSILFQRYWSIDFLQAAISLAIQSKSEDGFLKEIWLQLFDCLIPSSSSESMD